MYGGDKPFVEKPVHHDHAPQYRICGLCCRNKREIAPSPGQFSSALQGWCLPQMFSAGFSSCSTLSCFLPSACSPVQAPSLLSFQLPPVFRPPLEVLSLSFSTTQSPCFHHSGPTKSPTFFLPSPGLWLCSVSLLHSCFPGLCSLFPLIIHVACSLLVS